MEGGNGHQASCGPWDLIPHRISHTNVEGPWWPDSDGIKQLSSICDHLSLALDSSLTGRP